MRRLEYCGKGQMRDADTKLLVSPKAVAAEFNVIADELERLRAATTVAAGGDECKDGDVIS